MGIVVRSKVKVSKKKTGLKALRARTGLRENTWGGGEVSTVPLAPETGGPGGGKRGMDGFMGRGTT